GVRGGDHAARERGASGDPPGGGHLPGRDHHLRDPRAGKAWRPGGVPGGDRGGAGPGRRARQRLTACNAMACTLPVAWDDRLTGYGLGPGPPLAPVRVELTIALAGAFGVLAEPGVTVAAPAAASMTELELIHDPRYIAAVRAGAADAAFGLG